MGTDAAPRGCAAGLSLDHATHTDARLCREAEDGGCRRGTLRIYKRPIVSLARVYSSHPDLPDVDDATSLWRYVDLCRYLDLLQTAELHLTRADQMEDRWEGAYSMVNVAARPDLYAEHLDVMSKTMPLMYQHARTRTYLNCWYVGEAQSYAMWKLYDAAGKGVAIRTTGARLKRALVGDHRPALSGAKVQYVDYDATFIPEGNLFLPYIHKRESFEFEHEYRLLAMWSPKSLEVDEHNTAVRTEPDLPPPFLREQVELAVLIERVYVSPDAPAWVAGVVREVTARYRADVDVVHSDLAADPVY